jgi:hypothetical protein
MRWIIDAINKAAAIGMLILGVLLSVVFIFLGSAAVANEDLLKSHGIATDAIVTDTQRDTGRYGESGYKLHYQFQPEAGGDWYSYSDELDRRNLWYSPSMAEWELAQSTQRIRILYLPDDPWINRPVDESPVGDAIAGMVLGLMAAGLCVVGVAGYIRRRLRLQYYMNRIPPDTIDAVVHYLRRIQTEGGKRNAVFFTLGDHPKYWIQCASHPGSHTVCAEAADNSSLTGSAALNRKQLSQLWYLGWPRPNVRHPGCRREWWAATEADRQMIACRVMQTFDEVYGLNPDHAQHAHLVLDESVE